MPVTRQSGPPLAPGHCRGCAGPEPTPPERWENDEGQGLGPVGKAAPVHFFLSAPAQDEGGGEYSEDNHVERRRARVGGPDGQQGQQGQPQQGAEAGEGVDIGITTC